MQPVASIVVLLIACSVSHAATFVVDTTDADPTGALSFCTSAPGDCSLRGALLLAEQDAAQDTIEFVIPATQPGCAAGVCSIQLAAPGSWTYLNHPLVLDARTQPGYAANSIAASSGAIDGAPAIRLVGPAAFGFRDNGAMFGLRIENLRLRFNPDALAWTFQGNWFLASTVIEFLKENYASGLQDIQFGGLLPAQRNWLSQGASLTVQQGALGMKMRMEGNLVGTTLSGLAHEPASMASQLRVEGYAYASDILIGGTDPDARNVFSSGTAYGSAIYAEGHPGRVRIEGNHLGVGVDGQAPLEMVAAVVGNGFSLGGELPEQGNLIGHASRGHCVVELSYVAYGEGRGLVLGNRFLDNAGPTAICTDQVFGRPRSPNDAGDIDGGMPPGSPPMPGYEPTGTNLQQNAPEISAFDVVGSTVILTYRVDTQPQYGSWPMRVEFYFTTTDEGEELLHVDSYAQAEAQQFKTLSFTLPAGLTLDRSDVLVATASSPAPGFSTSHFSWYPVLLGFADSAPLARGVPTPVKVRVRTRPRAPGQSAWPFTPSGVVRITSNGTPPECGQAAIPPGVQECLAVLQPSAGDPSIAEGECALTLPVDHMAATVEVGARYCTRERAFADVSAAGSGVEEPLVTRTADVVEAPGDGLFCDSFEDNDPGCPAGNRAAGASSL